MRKNCKTFEEWVQSQYDEIQALIKKSDGWFESQHLGINVFYTHAINDGSVRCFIYNEQRNKTGYASVKAENWDDPTVIAIGLAWADYKKEDIPEKFKGKWYK